MSRAREAARPGRILVITYHFPPDGTVGGLRWEGLSKYLARRGWEVHVLMAAKQPQSVRDAGVHVHYCAPRPTLNDAYNNLMRRVRSSRAPAQAASTELPAPPVAPSAASPAMLSRNPIAFIRRTLAASLGFPDYGRGWIRPATTRARQLLRTAEFDAVITSGPPHSAHLIGKFAGVGHCPRWVDMRDPWAAILKQSWVQPFFATELARAFIPRLERFIFRRVDRVIANTPEFAQQLTAEYPHLRVSFVPNGIDPERVVPAASDAEKFDGLSIAYAGTLYAGRNLTLVLTAMQLHFAAHPEARGKIKLRVAGKLDDTHAGQLRRQVAGMGLENSVELIGLVPSADAMRMISRSHLALVLAQDQPMQVPAKLYECVAMQVPTLVIAESSSAAARQAIRLGAMASEPDDARSVQDIIDGLWSGRLPSRVPPKAPVDYDYIAGQIDALLREDIA